MTKTTRSEQARANAGKLFGRWREDWNTFAEDVLGVNLDEEQRKIVSAVQHNKLVSVRSGTARGKDFVSAVIAVCFLYLTPRWNEKGELVKNTKVALTAPTDRQVKNIMMPEVSRLFNRAKRRGFLLPGRLTTYDIRTDSDEWFLTGFKADENNHEAWSGFHAVNTMFIVTEATGIGEDTFAAIEGNLQGNSRLLIVFNPNITTGYAAKSQKQTRWQKFCLSDLNAPNVREKRIIIPGQVDYEWVQDKVENWCEQISPEDATPSEDDFEWEGKWYRPSDLFRKKVLGQFPKVDEETLIPPSWIEEAQARWKYNYQNDHNDGIMGLDVAGMGRDSSCRVYRYGNYVERIKKTNSGGKADHMATAGHANNYLTKHSGCCVSIDTIGEGAGVYSRLLEISAENNGRPRADSIISCKYSEAARYGNRELTDITGEYRFANMRAYCFWAVRDWLNPANGNEPMLPPGGTLLEEAAEIRWSFLSNGKIIIEPKEDIKDRLGYSPDEFDALANTFHPAAVRYASEYRDDGMADDDEDILY